MHMAGTCFVLKTCLNGTPAGLLGFGWTPTHNPVGAGPMMATQHSTNPAPPVGGLLSKLHVRITMPRLTMTIAMQLSMTPGKQQRPHMLTTHTTPGLLKGGSHFTIKEQLILCIACTNKTSMRSHTIASFCEHQAAWVSGTPSSVHTREDYVAMDGSSLLMMIPESI